MNDDRNFVCHYTTHQVLGSILENGELWLSNVKAMNDKSEMSHYINSLMLELKNTFCDRDNDIDALFSKYENQFKNESVYALSFSQFKDDAAQWERYANNGQGVCIVFDREKLSDLIRGKAFLQEVIYGPKQVNDPMYVELFTYLNEGHTFDSDKNIDDIFRDIWISSSVYKHESFQREGEIRLCQVPFSNNEIFYKMENWGIREYRKLSLFDEEDDKIPDGLINQVIVGPRSVYVDGILEKYINNYIKGVDVLYSQCPLR